MSELLDKYLKPYKVAVEEEKEFVRKMKSGELKPLNTGYKSVLNARLLRGLLPGEVLTICGLSGAGKTAFSLGVGLNIAELNQNVRLLVLCLEISARQMIGRAVAIKNKMSLRDLYDDTTPFDSALYDSLNELPIDFIEVPLSTKYIKAVIKSYHAKYPNDRIVVFVDHTLLVKNDGYDDNMVTLNKLSDVVLDTKKNLGTSFVLVSQLNNAMLNPARLSLRHSQYPDQTDIFGSKTIFHLSDMVTVLINPSRMNLPYSTYGPHELPQYVKVKTTGKTYNLIYAHSLKVRNGEPGINPMYDLLKYNILKEYPEDRDRVFQLKYFNKNKRS